MRLQYRYLPYTSSWWSFIFCFIFWVKKAISQFKDGSYEFTYAMAYGFPKASGRKDFVLSCDFSDRFIAKVIAKVILPMLPISPNNFQCQGKGRKKALDSFLRKKHKYKYVYKSDVKSYYQNINHRKLLDDLQEYIQSDSLMRLIIAYLNISYCKNGRWFSPEGKGIALGSTLSPIFSNLYLHEVDVFFDKNPRVFYIRYCDDILILTKNKRDLRRAIKMLKLLLSKRHLVLRYKKTFIGKTSDVIIYLGYRIHSKDKHCSAVGTSAMGTSAMGTSKQSKKRSELNRQLKLDVRTSSYSYEKKELGVKRHRRTKWNHWLHKIDLNLDSPYDKKSLIRSFNENNLRVEPSG